MAPPQHLARSSAVSVIFSFIFATTMGNKPSNNEETRSIEIGIQEYSYPDNRIISSKYTLWNFLPKNLFKQFRRLANFYFLCMSIITSVIDSPVSPWASVSPLVIVVSVSAIKQAFEDWLRHQADNKTNSVQVKVLHQGVEKFVASKDVRVGDIIEVKDDHDIPCDLVILMTSRQDGKCYTMTANLDGETNLKRLECPLNDLISRSNMACMRGKIECEKPTPDLYFFSGKLDVSINGRNLSKKEHPELLCAQGPVSESYRTLLTADNLLLKGSRLKNTEYVIGCAIYTGQDTKLALNSCKTSQKSARSERSINYFLVFFFCLLILEVVISVVMDFYEVNYGEKRPYLGPWSGLTAKNILNEFFSYIVLYYYIIPISLYVTVELQRFLGTFYLKWDEKLCYNDQYASAKTSDINEDLGQVEYVFTDKTGTLTENEMTFRNFSVNGHCYSESKGVILQNFPENEPFIGWSREMETLFLGMALCHTVQCCHDLETNPDTQIPSYEASSADEKALVEACARCGVIYLGDEAGTISIKFRDHIKKFKKLRIAEFTSDRKRMSVLVSQENGKGLLFCKGAECSVVPLVSEGLLEKELHNAKSFSLMGLRTLVFGWREIEEEELKVILNGTDLPESKLTILGVTAVEDCLQQDVRSTLTYLSAAGIKIWILTGDRVETSMMVALACGLIDTDMVQLSCVGMSDPTSCFTQLETLRSQIQLSKMYYCLVLDGRSLKIASDDPECITLLADIALNAETVVCCRLAPKQKAEIVRLVKESTRRPLVLSIGDGANDVAMIQEAHVGIGILGKEGRQAVNNADFVLPVFCALRRTLFVHGHWYYLRLATLVQYFFYKNIVFITPQVFFAIHNGVSPQPLFSSVFLLLYNTAFTSLPILLHAILEQDHSEENLMKIPGLYTEQKGNALLTWKQFFKWVICGVWHSVAVYFLPWALVMRNPILIPMGQTIDLTGFGTTVIHCSIIVVNLKLLLYSHFWTLYYIASFILSVVGFILFTLVFNFVDPIDPMFGVYTKLVTSLQFWLLTILVTVVSLIPDSVLHVVVKMFSERKLARHFIGGKRGSYHVQCVSS